MRFRKTRTQKILGRLEAALLRDLSAPRLAPEKGWLLRKHKNYLRAVSYTYSADEITITLKPASVIRRDYYVEVGP